jgi:hypothetical protein
MVERIIAVSVIGAPNAALCVSIYMVARGLGDGTGQTQLSFDFGVGLMLLMIDLRRQSVISFWIWNHNRRNPIIKYINDLTKQ